MMGGSHRPTTFSYISLSENNSESAASVGGTTEFLKNDPTGVALNIGDIVYYTVNGLGYVTKSATVANYTGKIAGVVVGGTKTFHAAIQDDSAIGSLAANVGENVLVAYQGIVKVKSAAAYAVLAQIGVSTTSGQPSANSTSGQVIGIALQVAGGAGVVTRVKLRIT